MSKTYTVAKHPAATKTTKPKSTQAQAAAMIRQTLKTAYPTVTFKVTSSSFSMGNDVKITWTDGPTTKQVDALVSQHEYGHFDGMTDMYEYSNKREDIPQAKYVTTTRTMSDDAHRATVDLINKRFGLHLALIEREDRGHRWLSLDHETDTHNGNEWDSYKIHRTFAETSLVCRHCGAHTLPGDVFCPDCGKVLGCETCKEAFTDSGSNGRDQEYPSLCWSCAYDVRDKQEAKPTGLYLVQTA